MTPVRAEGIQIRKYPDRSLETATPQTLSFPASNIFPAKSSAYPVYYRRSKRGQEIPSNCRKHDTGNRTRNVLFVETRKTRKFRTRSCSKVAMMTQKCFGPMS